jgi:DNA-binding transcriptional LysR family regulator
MHVHLRELHYFVTVAEHLNFTRAAEALFISQPALSKQIRALENRLRTPLFHRDRRSVRLTPVGEALLPGSRAALAAWADASAAAAAASARSAAALVVGMSTGLGRGLLPAVRARFSALAPAAQLDLKLVAWNDPTGGLAGPDPVDAAFVWLPIPDPRRYEWMPVAREDRLLALPAGHRLAARRTVDFVDLLDEPFLALPRASGPLRDFWLGTDARQGRPPVIGAEIASTEETVEALNARLGVCLLAAGNAPLVTRDGITTRPVTGIGPSELVLAWRAGDHRRLLQYLRSSVQGALAGAADAAPPA